MQMYFDSFGMPPPQEEMNLFHANHDTLSYNKTQIQDIKSNCCGFFAIAFIKYMSINNAFGVKKADKFIAMFDLQNKKKNDEIAKNIVLNYIKE